MEQVRETFDTSPELLLRTARRVSETSQLPTEAVTAAVRDVAVRVLDVDATSMREEMTGILMGRGVHLALQWLYDAGVLQVVLPELAATVNFSQEAGRKHKDVWDHTKQVVRQSVPRPTVRWASVLHDIGKMPTRTFTTDGKVHFHRQSE